MATATQCPPQRLLVPSSSEPPSPSPALVPASLKPYWGDWVAMIFWTGCFALMAIIHLTNLVMALLR
jgi:hypothetical protein